MKKALFLIAIITIMTSVLIAGSVSVNVYEKVPTVLVKLENKDFDTRAMYAMIKLYQENQNFNLGQIIIKMNPSEEVKVLVKKKDLEKLLNRDVEYTKFMKTYAIFI